MNFEVEYKLPLLKKNMQFYQAGVNNLPRKSITKHLIC